MLDFVGLGAQKSGTTTVHDLLRQHPDLTLPAGKEVPLFHEERTEHDIRRELERVMPVDGRRRRGKISPQYLVSPRAVDNLSRWCPRARLFVVLRDPVERARSHHRMVVRRGDESRSFAEAIDHQLEHVGSADEAIDRPERDCYLAWGLYGELLDRYLGPFAPEQLLVTWTADLESDPAAFIRSIHRHIGVDPVEPAALHLRANPTGADGWRMKALRHARQLPFYDTAKRVVPTTTRRSMAFRVEVSSRTAPERVGACDLPPSTSAALRDRFAADHRRLADIVGQRAPWSTEVEP